MLSRSSTSSWPFVLLFCSLVLFVDAQDTSEPSVEPTFTPMTSQTVNFIFSGVLGGVFVATLGYFVVGYWMEEAESVLSKKEGDAEFNNEAVETIRDSDDVQLLKPNSSSPNDVYF